MTKKETETKPTEEKAELPGFDLNEYIAGPLQDTGLIIKREIATIPAKKPNSQQWIRVHPTDEILVDVIDWKDEGTLYLVSQSKLSLMFEQTKRVRLHIAMFLSGNPFLLPVPQPDVNGNWNQWHKSLARMAEMAKTHWLRIQPDRTINGYIPYIAEGKIAEPIWPDKTISEYLAISFRDNIIDSEDHPIVK